MDKENKDMKYNFIIPYRNRKENLGECIKRFTEMVKEGIDAHFYIIHQLHPGPFNRGAVKNIGFMEACKTRSDGLFIFHDVDIYPTYWGSINYDTKKGEVRHPVGLKNENLGTICCFWKSEFEAVNGFPNYWGWGIEDVTIMYRVKNVNIKIDEQHIVDLNDRTKCICPVHDRHTTQNDTCIINTALHHEEMKSGQNKNGLSSITYTVLSTLAYTPLFTVINVDFTITN
jgi:hypothetical protein